MAEKSLIGGLAGLDSGNDDKLNPVYYSKQYDKILNGYSTLLNRRGLMDASADYRKAFEAVNPEAAANANYYKTAGKAIFEDPNTFLGDYESLRAGNLDALNGVYKNVLDYGLGGIKGRLAAGGYGNTGPSSYDRILNAQMTTSNIAPVLQTLFGNLGRDAGASYGSRMQNNQNKLGLMAQDFLTQYANNNAARSLTPYLTQGALVRNNTGTIGDIVNTLKNNTAGYELEKGLATRLDESAEGVQNAMKFATSMYGNIAGLGGGMGGGAGAAPASASPSAGLPSGMSGNFLQQIMSMLGRNGATGTPSNQGVDSQSYNNINDYFGNSAIA